MNNWIKLVDEHKAHIDMLLKELKEKNEEIRHYRETLKEILETEEETCVDDVNEMKRIAREELEDDE